MATYSYIISDPNFSYNDGSADSTANNQGWIVINGSTLRIINQRSVAHNNSSGLPGEMCIGTDSGFTYLYICTATNTWQRIAFSSSSW